MQKKDYLMALHNLFCISHGFHSSSTHACHRRRIGREFSMYLQLFILKWNHLFHSLYQNITTQEKNREAITPKTNSHQHWLFQILLLKKVVAKNINASLSKLILSPCCVSPFPLPITADRTPPGAAGNNGWPVQGSMPGHWWALIPSPADVIYDMAHMFQQPRL